MMILESLNMDDLDIELFLLDCQEEIANYEQERKEEINQKPIWWNKLLGITESTEEEYQQARCIHAEFKDFSMNKSEMSLNELFRAFEQFKLFNKKWR